MSCLGEKIAPVAINSAAEVRHLFAQFRAEIAARVETLAEQSGLPAQEVMRDFLPHLREHHLAASTDLLLSLAVATTPVTPHRLDFYNALANEELTGCGFPLA